MEQITDYNAESKFDITNILYILDSNFNDYEIMIVEKSLGLYKAGNYITYKALVLPITIFVVQRKCFEFKDSDIDNNLKALISFKVFSSKELLTQFKNQIIDSKIKELNSKR